MASRRSAGQGGRRYTAAGTTRPGAAVEGGGEGGGAPEYDPGVDTLIMTDSLGTYQYVGDDQTTVGSRYKQLVDLRNSEGSNHTPFVSDNRGVDNPTGTEAGGDGFFENHRIGVGRTAAYALRSRFRPEITPPPNEVSAWITWPIQQKYTGNNSTIAWSIYMNIVNKTGIDFPGFKFMEFWNANGANRTQVSINGGDPGDERFGVNPYGAGDYALQPTGTTRWNDLSQGVWYRLRFMYRPSDVLGDQLGIVRFWIDDEKIIDMSAAGVTEGFCTTADVEEIRADPIHFLKFPDTLNQTTNQSEALILDYSDFSWWKIGS